MVPPLLRKTAEHATTKRGGAGSLDGNNMNEDRTNTLRLPARTDHIEVSISRSELLLLLGGLHERLDAFFEEIQTLPQTTTRLNAGKRRSAASE